MQKILIYHRNCMDGFCSAYLFWKEHPDAEFMPWNYGEDLPDPEQFRDRDITMVDVSFPRELMEKINALASSFHCYDHHKTAEAALDGLPYCTFDMNESGASLLYDALWPNSTRNTLVSYARDHDLFLFELKHSKLIRNVIQSTPYFFEDWKFLEHELETDIKIIVKGGHFVALWKRQAINFAIQKAEPLTLCGYKGRMTNNSTNSLFSEIAGQLAEDSDFGMCWWYEKGMYTYSLRSRKGSGVDVSKICKQFGGGGHENAAGFRSEFSPVGLLEWEERT